MSQLHEFQAQAAQALIWPRAKDEAFTWVNTRKLPEYIHALQTQAKALELNALPLTQPSAGLLSDPLACASLAQISQGHLIPVQGREEYREITLPAGAHFLQIQCAEHSESEFFIELSEHSHLILDLQIQSHAQLKLRICGSQTQLNFAHVHAQLDQSAQLHALHLSLDNTFQRSSWRIHLNAPQADAKLRTLSLGADQAQSHHHVQIFHHAPQTTSDQIAAQVLGGQAESSFDGTVIVDQVAQESFSEQIVRSLLLSDHAKVHCKPNLQISADNVKCAHGNTCGSLEQGELFYLQSRGLSESEARQILTLGFCETVLEDMSQDRLRSLLHSRIAQTLNRIQEHAS